MNSLIALGAMLLTIQGGGSGGGGNDNPTPIRDWTVVNQPFGENASTLPSVVTSCAPATPNPRIMVDDFVPIHPLLPSGPRPISISQIDWWGYIDVNGWNPYATFYIAIYDHQGSGTLGSPNRSSIVWQECLTAFSIQTASDCLSGDPIYKFSIKPLTANPLVLTNERRYWIQISEADPNGNFKWACRAPVNGYGPIRYSANPMDLGSTGHRSPCTSERVDMVFTLWTRV